MFPVCPVPILYWYEPGPLPRVWALLLAWAAPAHRGSLNSKCSVPDGSSARTVMGHVCWPSNQQRTRALEGKIKSSYVDSYISVLKIIIAGIWSIVFWMYFLLWSRIRLNKIIKYGQFRTFAIWYLLLFISLQGQAKSCNVLVRNEWEGVHDLHKHNTISMTEISEPCVSVLFIS